MNDSVSHFTTLSVSQILSSLSQLLYQSINQLVSKILQSDSKNASFYKDS